MAQGEDPTASPIDDHRSRRADLELSFLPCALSSSLSMFGAFPDNRVFVGIQSNKKPGLIPAPGGESGEIKEEKSGHPETRTGRVRNDRDENN